VVDHRALIDLGQPVIGRTGQDDAVGPDLDSTIRILVHIDILVDERARHLGNIEPVEDPVVLYGQRLRYAARFAPRQDCIEMLVFARWPVRIEGALRGLAKHALKSAMK
jgi:hypothetical protein